MKITGKTDPPAIILSKALTFTLDSDLLQTLILRKQASRKTRKPGGGVRLKRDGAPVTGKRGSRPETPLLRWKFVERKEEDNGEFESEKHSDCDRKSGRKVRRDGDVATVSARKLAAGLWRLQLPDVSVNGGGELCNVSKNNGFVFQPTIDHSGIHSPAHHNRKSFDSCMKEVPRSPNSVNGSRNKFLHKLEPTFHFSNSATEGVTKWDPHSYKTSEDAKRIYSESKHLESQLDHARARIHNLENERKSSKKKLEQFLNKLNEERATWRIREHEKIRAVIDDIKNELNRERKTRKRTEIVNSKLVTELTDSKLSAKRYLQDCEKERKARELIEDVCDELAKEIGEDKAEIEDLKQESMKMRNEVDDERKMLQMAEVWREERVQMKLVDAKITLEKEYSRMNELVVDLESFLNSKSMNLDNEEMKRFETLKKSVHLVNIQEIGEFKYDPPNPDDIFSGFENLNFEEIKEIEQNGDDVDDDVDDDVEDESRWETVSHVDDHESNYSPDGSDPSVANNFRDSYLSVSRREFEENENEGTQIIEIPSNKHLKKGSSISRFWRSSYSSNGENKRLSNGTHFSPDRSSGVSPSEWSCSPGSGRKLPGGGMRKDSLKSKLLEARMESQRIQLRQILKQKI